MQQQQQHQQPERLLTLAMGHRIGYKILVAHHHERVAEAA